MDEKQDLETDEMWSDIDRVESKITPRLRAEEVGVIMALDGMRRLGRGERIATYHTGTAHIRAIF